MLYYGDIHIDIGIEIKKIINKYPDLWERQKIEKGTFLYEINKPVKKIFYCESGITRVFIYSEGKEITNSFFFENELIVPLLTLTKNIPAVANLQVIEDSYMQTIKINDWKIIEKQEPSLMSILLDVAIKGFLKMFQYQMCNSINNNKERYLNLFENYPNLYRVKDKYIASYLGIDAITLSRIKSSPANDNIKN